MMYTTKGVELVEEIVRLKAKLEDIDSDIEEENSAIQDGYADLIKYKKERGELKQKIDGIREQLKEEIV